MNDMDRIRQGFAILEPYTGGEVEVALDQIYAGPEGVRISDSDAARLEALSWTYDEDIERWYY
jgi:hypothetical protein